NQPTQALMGGQYVQIASLGDVKNYGQIFADREAQISSDKNIQNFEGLIQSKGGLEMSAGQDILNQAGQIFSQGDMILKAGANIASTNIKVREGAYDNWQDKIVAFGSIG